MTPVHLHLLLNHVPVLATILGFVLLAGAVTFRHEAYQRLAMVIFIGSALVALPVYFSGEPAEHSLEPVAAVPEAFVEPHEESALVSLSSLLLVGLGALAALWSGRGKRALARPLVLATLALGLVSAGSIAWTAYLGGEIRHSEIRSRSVVPDPESSDGRGNSPGHVDRD